MRYIEPFIKQDLTKKMAFVGGPRQVGKTTLAQHILTQISGRYFNWDYDVDRQAMLAMQGYQLKPGQKANSRGYS